ncbi:MAG TPA: SAM-dependent chlorinase/fluorinase [Candidatus Hydrogenedens sp.]|nr:SAM-dependent chlorinase/fluorinase [Candidatus Hydrogenedens sp.]HPP58363.1 SAM-dependent chlorinase/fluorinase [Candidatus Hydrogenedens sp.]
MEKIKHITLLTDFGNKDPYVAEIKGVLFSALPNISIIDLSHEISPQNIIEGALFLERMWEYWQIPSVHIAIIDPGVGTERRILLIHENQKFLICPDNGVATFVIKNKHAEARHVTYFETANQLISNTFHGRDIMAPLAIQLARGGNCEDFGHIVDDFQLIHIPCVDIKDNYIYGEVIHIDHFGNAVTNIKREHLQGCTPLYARIKGGLKKIPFSSSYGKVCIGQALCLFGSGNRLEIAVNCGSAEKQLKVKIGTKILLILNRD